MSGLEHSDRQGRLVDLVLQQGRDDELAATRAELARDLGLAVESGELRMLFDELRTLTVEPTGNVRLAVRHAIDRRLRLLRGEAPRSRLLRVAQVAAVAAAALVVFVLVDRAARREAGGSELAAIESAGKSRTPPTPDAELIALLARQHLPVRDATFVACLERFEALPLPDSFAGWLEASQDLAQLREQFRLRFSPEARRPLLRAHGSPILEDRLASLAATVAVRIERDLTAGAASIEDLSYGLRSMLAVGSSRQRGPHRRAVERCAAELIERLPELDAGEAASALAALADLAVLEGGGLVDLVGAHADRLARATLTEGPAGRPELLHWLTPLSQLADAGRVLRTAPAFGVHAGLAFRARMMVAAHLEERIEEQRGMERPSLLAARLYGFGDLVDRDETEHALRLWSPDMLLPDYVALHHLAWSKYPARPGWARFQQDLRGLSGVSTPAATRDAAVLLLSLTMNFASPGVIDPRSA